LESRLDALLDQYEGSLGLPSSCPKEVEVEATRLLTITPAELAALDRQQREDAAFTLEQFALFLQKSINREVARSHWAEERLKKVLGVKMPKHHAYSYEERRALALEGDEDAQRLERVRMEAVLRIDRASFLSNRIASLAKTLLGSQQRRNNG
jgi:hypothetical protein